MICNINRLRQPANPRLDPSIARVLDFMTAHGHGSYARQIDELSSTFDEVQAEAGPFGPDCPDTQTQLDKIDEEIWEVAQAAADRYDDWASDPLP